MNKQSQYNVPKTLIKDVGTGEDTLGLIGKQIRLTHVPALHPLMEVLGITIPYYEGAVGTVVHVAENGDYWADFGDDENVQLQGPKDDQRRLWDFAAADGDGLGYEDDHVTYEVLGESPEVAKEAA